MAVEELCFAQTWQNPVANVAVKRKILYKAAVNHKLTFQFNYWPPLGLFFNHKTSILTNININNRHYYMEQLLSQFLNASVKDWNWFGLSVQSSLVVLCESAPTLVFWLFTVVPQVTARGQPLMQPLPFPVVFFLRDVFPFSPSACVKLG